LPYHSPHKFRHGHAVYALKNAKDIPALKAVSQNLMHKNLSVTDGVYGVLSTLDVQKQIATIGNSVAKSSNSNELLILLKRVLEELEARKVS
jgi:site-specific recombinase XerC